VLSISVIRQYVIGAAPVLAQVRDAGQIEQAMHNLHGQAFQERQRSSASRSIAAVQAEERRRTQEHVRNELLALDRVVVENDLGSNGAGVRLMHERACAGCCIDSVALKRAWGASHTPRRELLNRLADSFYYYHLRDEWLIRTLLLLDCTRAALSSRDGAKQGEADHHLVDSLAVTMITLKQSEAAPELHCGMRDIIVRLAMKVGMVTRDWTEFWKLVIKRELHMCLSIGFRSAGPTPLDLALCLAQDVAGEATVTHGANELASVWLGFEKGRSSAPAPGKLAGVLPAVPRQRFTLLASYIIELGIMCAPLPEGTKSATALALAALRLAMGAFGKAAPAECMARLEMWVHELLGLEVQHLSRLEHGLRELWARPPKDIQSVVRKWADRAAQGYLGGRLPAAPEASATLAEMLPLLPPNPDAQQASALSPETAERRRSQWHHMNATPCDKSSSAISVQGCASAQETARCSVAIEYGHDAAKPASLQAQPLQCGRGQEVDEVLASGDNAGDPLTQLDCISFQEHVSADEPALHADATERGRTAAKPAPPLAQPLQYARTQEVDKVLASSDNAKDPESLMGMPSGTSVQGYVPVDEIAFYPEVVESSHDETKPACRHAQLLPHARAQAVDEVFASSPGARMGGPSDDQVCLSVDETLHCSEATERSQNAIKPAFLLALPLQCARTQENAEVLAPKDRGRDPEVQLGKPCGIRVQGCVPVDATALYSEANECSHDEAKPACLPAQPLQCARTQDVDKVLASNDSAGDPKAQLGMSSVISVPGRISTNEASRDSKVIECGRNAAKPASPLPQTPKGKRRAATRTTDEGIAEPWHSPALALKRARTSAPEAADGRHVHPLGEPSVADEGLDPSLDGASGQIIDKGLDGASFSEPPAAAEGLDVVAAEGFEVPSLAKPVAAADGHDAPSLAEPSVAAEGLGPSLDVVAAEGLEAPSLAEPSVAADGLDLSLEGALGQINVKGLDVVAFSEPSAAAEGLDVVAADGLEAPSLAEPSVAADGPDPSPEGALGQIMDDGLVAAEGLDAVAAEGLDVVHIEEDVNLLLTRLIPRIAELAGEVTAASEVEDFRLANTRQEQMKPLVAKLSRSSVCSCCWIEAPSASIRKHRSDTSWSEPWIYAPKQKGQLLCSHCNKHALSTLLAAPLLHRKHGLKSLQCRASAEARSSNPRLLTSCG
jgi:hypothetical protein